MAKLFYSVWVGGGEITDYYLESAKEAFDLARWWKRDNGYNDTAVEVLVQGATEIEHLEWIKSF